MLSTQTFAFITAKSDPDTLMHHEAMMADSKQGFQDEMEIEIAGH